VIIIGVAAAAIHLCIQTNLRASAIYTSTKKGAFRRNRNDSAMDAIFAEESPEADWASPKTMENGSTSVLTNAASKEHAEVRDATASPATNTAMAKDNDTSTQAPSKVVEGLPVDLQRALPNLFLAGVQKSGTTAISVFLEQQGMVCESEVFEGEPGSFYSKKEIQFFNSEPRYELGPTFYAKHYQHCLRRSKHGDVPYIMDGTPNTQLVPERVHDFYSKYATPQQMKDLKIIFSVREPVSREMSWYNHWLDGITRGFHSSEIPLYEQSETGQKATPHFFERAFLPQLMYNKENDQLKGLYYKTFKPWFDLFDRKQILILSYDEVQHKPATAMGRIADFLNVTQKSGDSGKRENNAALPKKNTKEKRLGLLPNCTMQQHLQSLFQNDTEMFYQLLEDYPGPPMEQRPFPKFPPFKCYQ